MLALLTILAQATLDDANKGVDTLEKVSRGSVAFILLIMLILAIVGFVWQYRRNNKIEDDHRDEELTRSKQDKVDAASTLSAIKLDAENVRKEMLALVRERTQAERDTDESLSGTTRAMERVGFVLERVERLLERVERLMERLERKFGG
jgi:Tfp pilus assembly protein PilO